MCGRGRLFPDTEQPPQNAPHAAGRTPHHDLHALTSCHASTPRRRRSAETPPETSGTPPETRRRSGCPVPAPARRSPETSFHRHIVARYIPPLLQYMKERTRRAWRAARRCFLSFRAGANTGVGIRLPKKEKRIAASPHCRTPSPTRGSTYRPVGRGPRAPPPGTHFSAGHMGSALQVHTPPKKQRGAPQGAPRVFRPCVAQTEEGYIRRLMQAGTALSTLIWKRRYTRYRCREPRKRPCSPRPRSWCLHLQQSCWTGRNSQTYRP